MTGQYPIRRGWQPAPAAEFGNGDEDPQSLDYASAHTSGLQGILHLLRQHVKGLLLWTFVCIGFGALYLNQTPPEYVATTQVVLEPRRAVAGVPDLAAASYGATLDSAQADSQVQVVKSERTLRYVFDTLALGNDPAFAREPPGLIAELLTWLPRHAPQQGPSAAEEASTALARAFQAFIDRISVRRIGQSYVLEISFRAPAPAQAAKLANAVTAAYIRDNIAYGAAAVQRGTEVLQGRISDIQTEQDLAADAVRKGVLPDASFPDSDARVVSGALQPLGKAYPQSKLILLLATSLGLLSGAAWIIARHTFDRTIRNRQQIGRAFHVVGLSEVPWFRHPASSRFARQELTYTSALETESRFSEALRALRTLVLSNRKASRQMCIGVVSWSAGEGRSSIASNLAMLIAASQARVVLIDAHFDHPDLSRRLGPHALKGLDEVLLNNLADLDQLAVSLAPNLAFVPAVAEGCTANANVFIGSAETARLLQLFRDHQDVIVDLPPMSYSSDTQAIAHLLDGVILVVEANRTSFDDLDEAHRALQIAGIPILRIVLNKSPDPTGRDRGREPRGAKSGGEPDTAASFQKSEALS